MILTSQIQQRQRRVLLQSLRNRLCTFVSNLVVRFIHEEKSESEYEKSKHISKQIHSNNISNNVQIMDAVESQKNKSQNYLVREDRGLKK